VQASPSKIKLTFAVDENGKFIGISEAERAGKYFCITCSENLIVRKGPIRRHHFSHKGGSSCSFESMLHQLAKNIIYDAESIAMPNFRSHHRILKAELESSPCSGIISDIVLETEKERVAVEIKVRHKKSEEDIRKFKQHNISVMELDLSTDQLPVSMSALRDWILCKAKRNWLNRRVDFSKIVGTVVREPAKRGTDKKYDRREVSSTKNALSDFERLFEEEPYQVRILPIETLSKRFPNIKMSFEPNVVSLKKLKTTQFGWEGIVSIKSEKDASIREYPFFYCKQKSLFNESDVKQVYAIVDEQRAWRDGYYLMQFKNIMMWVKKLRYASREYQAYDW
jgi:hypothetical protein